MKATDIRGNDRRSGPLGRIKAGVEDDYTAFHLYGGTDIAVNTCCVRKYRNVLR